MFGFIFGIAFWVASYVPVAFPWYMMYSPSCVLVVIAPRVSRIHAMSVCRLRILFIISVLFCWVRPSSTFMGTSVSRPCPSSRLRFVISSRLRFVSGSCLFVFLLMFCMVVFSARRFSMFYCISRDFMVVILNSLFVFLPSGSFPAFYGLFYFRRVSLVLFCLFGCVGGMLHFFIFVVILIFMWYLRSLPICGILFGIFEDVVWVL